MAGPLVRATIDLDAIAENIVSLRSLIPDTCLFMAVVKANAYGHGAIHVAKKALAAGASWLGVARLEEALLLRRAGIFAPALIFGYVYPEQVVRILDHNLTVTVYNLQMAQAFSETAKRLGKKLDVHLKVDTGMGRVGMIIDKSFSRNDSGKLLVREIETIAILPGIRLKGIYTHFAAADSRDKWYTKNQIKFFNSLLTDLGHRGIEFQIRHAANSAGIIAHPQAHYDMVRCGIALYGLPPSEEIDLSNITLVPAMTLKATVTTVKKVPENFFVGYGMTHQTSQKTLIASVSIGYADGFSRLFSSNGSMLVKGKRAPVIGRVCMDQTMIDVGHIKGVAVGDEVVILGCQGDECITAEELAGRASTINYEIVSALTARIGLDYKNKKVFS